MTLCNCCEKLLSNHNWRRYIRTNHQCNFCDVPELISEINDLVEVLKVGEKATICGISFIKVDDNILLNLNELDKDEILKIYFEEVQE